MLFDEGQSDERNSELHNKLERMRRKVMRHLFLYLQGVIVKVPRNPLVRNTLVHPKKSVLNAVSAFKSACCLRCWACRVHVWCFWW